MQQLSNITDLIKSKPPLVSSGVVHTYYLIPADPATGVLFITPNSPHFISGQVRLRGKDGGRYPFNYLEMLDTIFGKEKNTIEVCSGSVKEDCFTVDIHPDAKPDLVTE